MTTDILEINNFIVLIEQSDDQKPTVEYCMLDDQVIGFSFYASGDVEIEISFDDQVSKVQNSTGIATAFFGNKNATFKHNISNKTPLRSVSIFSTLNNLNKLPKQERAVYVNSLRSLLNPRAHYVQGPFFYMTPPMYNAVYKIFQTEYEGIARLMFLQSQITELMAHFFALLQTGNKIQISKSDQEKLFNAKSIMIEKMAAPPSLNELSKMIGLNSNKLKKNFKELFGMPVFKYLQHERLNKAHQLLSDQEMNIQEVAWFVGYESISSFSNAFLKKFGIRPSDLHK